MAFADPPNTICTPYVGRVIKGWRVQVRICLRLSEAEAALSTVYADLWNTQSNIATYIDALSDATFVPLSQEVQVGAAGVSGNYDEAEDSAVFTFQTTLGPIAKISIPAPKSSIFLVDNQTIDPANTAVSNFVSALTSGNWAIATTSGFFGCTKTGSVYTSFIGGLRVRRKTRRKYNIFVRNPELSAPGI